MSIQDNLRRVKESIGPARLVSVTKTVPADAVNEAIRAGADCIGESRIQESGEKLPELLPCEKHLIGHLQTNKVKRAVQLFDVIESVDSIKCAHEISKRSLEQGKRQRVLLQVNIGSEEEKHGFLPDKFEETLAELLECEGLQVEGLMCITPFVGREEVRVYFQRMRLLFEKLREHYPRHMKELSMGMSRDYDIAVQEGATIVRVGSGIFGERRGT